MTGYRTLLALRLRGYQPASVHVSILDHDAPRGNWLHADQSLALGADAHVDIEPGDDLCGLDMRALHGCTVHLAGHDHQRLAQAWTRILDIEPARLLCAWPAPESRILDWSPEHGLVELETA